MEKHTFSLIVADWTPYHPFSEFARLEKTATKKKPHIILEAYHEASDADVLLCVRIIDWQTLNPVPPYYVSSSMFQNLFNDFGYRVDFIP